MSRSLRAVVGVVMLIGFASLALAQGGQPGERGRGMWDDGPRWGMSPAWHMGMWRWRGGRGADWMLERIEGRLAFAKTELKITEAQSAAWNELADAVRAAAKHRNERMKNVFSGDERTKTLPERVEAQEQLMTVSVEEIKLIKAALKNLYAVLSDEQKKEADEMDIPMVGMMGGPWG
jgi:LTXXQ motif family protein